jgi:hypothetical protein
MGSEDDVLPFPIKGFERQKNQAGRHAVLCIVSERWLQFPEQGSGCIQLGEPLKIEVMTKDKTGNDKKICDLIVTREDLLRAIGAVKPSDEPERS